MQRVSDGSARGRRWRGTAAAIAALTAAGLEARADCGELTALDGSVPLVASNSIEAFAAWDPDGPAGPHPNLMVIGGGFAEAGGLPNVGGIVGWSDASGPMRLGSETDPHRPQSVSLLATLDPDGAGPEPVLLWAVCDNSSRLAYFNGVSWRSIGLRAGCHVSAMTTWDPDGPAGWKPRTIVLGGKEIESANVVNGWEVVALRFSSIGTINEFDVVLANAVDPNPTYGGDPVRALATWDGDGAGPDPESLVIGGRFNKIDGDRSCSNIVMLTPRNPNLSPDVDTLAGGVNRPVTSLLSFPLFGGVDQLVIGGDFWFELEDGSITSGLAAWNGTHYIVFGGSHHNVTQMASWDPNGAAAGGRRLVVNGHHDGVGYDVSGVVALNATTWRFDEVATGLDPAGEFVGHVAALGVWDANGGGLLPQYLFAGGDDASLVRVNQTPNWLGVPQPNPNGKVFAATYAHLGTPFTPPGNRLFIGGSFTQVGSQPVTNIAAWDGTRWESVSNGLNGAVHVLHRARLGFGPISGDSLFVGGNFTGLAVGGGVPLNRIVSVTTNILGEFQFTPLGSGTNGPVNAITVFDPDGSGPQPRVLVAGGSFTSAGGVTANRIATWNFSTQTWSTLGSGFNGTVHALAVWDPDRSGPVPPRLVAGGSFTSASGLPISHLAWWDGVQWQPFPFGAPNGSVMTLASWDRDSQVPLELVIGGYFTAIGSLPQQHIARYNGTSLDLDGFGHGVDGAVLSISFAEMNQEDTSPGLELVIAGEFSSAVDDPSGEFGRVAFWETRPGSQRWRTLPVAVWPSQLSLRPSVLTTMPLATAPGARPALLVGGDFRHAQRSLDNLLVYRGTDPYILAHPTFPSTEAACAGDSIALHVEATGDDLVYRWQKDGVNLLPGPTGSGSVLSGVDGPTLTIANASVQDEGAYRCIVSNLCDTAASQPAAVIVEPCCGSDLDEDGDVNVFDLLAYLDFWFSQDVRAERTGDAPAVIDVFDLLTYLDGWFAGC